LGRRRQYLADARLDMSPEPARGLVVDKRADICEGATRPTHATFLLNFFDELRRRAPGN